MKQFKFLQKIKPPRKEPAIIKLKDQFNRNLNLIVMWSQYPLDGDYSDIETFTGNILQFYDFIKAGQQTPTIYEIYTVRRGWVNQSMVFRNRHLYNNFMSRKFNLRIKYTLQ